MPDQTLFTTFNFRVEISVPGVSDDAICEAAFSECDGLELSMEPKTFQQGGDLTRQIHLAGPVTYSPLTLKRGMTADLGLWRWFTEVMKTDRRGLRGQASVVILAANGEPQVTFTLSDCLPIKLRAPALNAREGLLAIEELQIVYAALDIEFPGRGG
jgi:phage tail-like protein